MVGGVAGAGARPVCAQANVVKDADKSAHAHAIERRINVSPWID
jgi:hypothetical protein